jgi:WD40 repeat protein
MSVFACAACARRFNVGDVTAGQSVRCPHCGHLQPVPDAVPGNNTPPHAPLQSDTARVSEAVAVPPSADPQQAETVAFQAAPPDPAPLPRTDVSLPRGAVISSLPATLPPDPAIQPDAPELPAVPGYEILGELGRGGMGVVYKALHLRLNRVVAVKMILGGAHASEADLVRFLAEAEAVAHLQHLNIVQIYGSGQHKGLPFFTLEFVPGGSLADKVRAAPLPPRAAAHLIEQLARGVGYAHAQGVVHRDLKPGNVLLGADGTPKVTDFGLAKRVEGGAGLTRTGTVMGTPSYMAPEQAGGQKDVGPAADIYALGAILYELLTGRPPFQAPTAVDTVMQVVTNEPVPPRRLQPKLPRDLETICLKCLQKEPHRRYASAAELADDLARFREDRPIVARPVGRLERGWRWCKRNPVPATMAATLAAGALVALYFLNAERTRTLHNLERARSAEADLAVQLQKTRQAEREKTDKLWQSYFDRARAGFFSRQPGQRLDGLAALSAAARIRPAEQLRDQAIACMALVDLRTVKSGITLPEGAHSPAVDPSGKRYAYVDRTGAVSVRRLSDGSEVARRGPGNDPVVGGVEFSPDGRLLAVFSAAVVVVWDPERDQEIVRRPRRGFSFAFSPDSRQAAVGDDPTVRLFDLASGRERLALPTGLADLRFAFAPDGRRLAATGIWQSPAVRVYDCETGGLLQEFALPRTKAASGPSWHPDGERLAVGGADGRVYLFHVPRQKLLAVLEGHAQDVIITLFTPAGDHLLTTSWDGTLRLWEVATGRLLLSRAAPATTTTFAPQASRLGYVTDRNRSLQFIELADDREYRSLARDLAVGYGHNRSAAVSPDGRLLAVATAGGVRLWDLASGREPVHWPSPPCMAVAFMPDGSELLTSGPAGLQRWPIHPEPGAHGAVVIGPPRTARLPVIPTAFQLAADGRTAAVLSEKLQTVVLIDLESEQARPFRLNHPRCSYVALSPDGRWAATGGWHAPAQGIWDTRTGRLVHELKLGPQTAVYFSPDSRWLITTRPEEYCFWDMRTWRPGLRIARELAPYPGPLAFSRDGQWLAVELTPGVVGLLDWKAGRVLARLEDPTHDRANALCFSPDGAQLVTVACYDKTAHVWDLRRIRAGLKAIHLDWDAPDYPPAPPHSPLSPFKVIAGGGGQ